MIRKFDEYIKEEALPRGMWDEANTKALKGWTNKESDVEFVVTTNEPLRISTTDDVELAKIKMLLYKHDVKFDVKELQLK
jgi:hypothetical protein